MAEEVEEAAEVVAMVANKTENVMAVVAVKLPENSLLKEAAVAIENASAVVAKDAQFTCNFIHKVCKPNCFVSISNIISYVVKIVVLFFINYNYFQLV